MYQLKDSTGIIHLDNLTEQACWDYVVAYAKSKNKGYYYRKNLLENGKIWIDYGSHTHFFELIDLMKQPNENPHTMVKDEQ
jgi:hypothetical protein